MSHEHIRCPTFPRLREILQQHYDRCVDLAATLIEEQASMSHGELDKAVQTLMKAKVEMKLFEGYLEDHFPEEFPLDKTNIQ